jgi:hypothetical protein
MYYFEMSKLAQSLAPVTCILEVSGSKLDTAADYFRPGCP